MSEAIKRTNGKKGLHRRDFLLGTAALGVAAGVTAANSRSATAQVADGPIGNEFVIRGGHILTMDSGIADLPQGDIHVRDGIIVGVGANLGVPGAGVIDAADMIVMPGFVDTHSHLWNAFLRGSVRGDDPVRGYFPTTNRAAPLCTPDDAYASVRFGLMEELLSGTTCVNNFSHNTRSPEHADAEIRASLEVGARTRFSYGSPGRGEKLNIAGVDQTVKKWGGASPILTLGVNLQLPSPEVLKSGADDEAFLTEVRSAKDRALPLSFHYGNTAHGLVGMLDRNNLLGPDILMIHAQGFTPSEREVMVAKGTQFSMAPAIEIPYSTARNGYIQFGELEQLGASLSLSLDASSAVATADFFTVLRALQWAHKQRSDIDRTLEPKRIVEIATIGGARALGLGDRIGSITPGKEADIIMVRKTDYNMLPVIDPYYSLVYSGSASNVDTVIVRGDVLLRQRKHKNLDVAEIGKLGAEAGQRMHEKLEALIAKGQENKDKLNTKG